ncbi:hypothetical protein ACNKHM_11225 [Shigella sonnei]
MSVKIELSINLCLLPPLPIPGNHGIKWVITHPWHFPQKPSLEECGIDNHFQSH